jgi:hypothetical protein
MDWIFWFKVPRVPPLHAAHLRVEVALHRVFDGNEQREVRPTQLSQRCCDNLPIWEKLGELHHPAKVLLAIAALQLCTQCVHNLLTVA